MSLDIYLDIEGVDGESSDKEYAGVINVLSWAWGMTQSGTTHMGTGGGAGKVNVQDISITKWIDKASPTLMKMCMNGKHFEEAKLMVRKAGGDAPLTYLTVTMKHGLVTSVSTGGSGGEDRLTENVTLNFAEVLVTYVPQLPDGTGDASIEIGWNIAENVEAA